MPRQQGFRIDTQPKQALPPSKALRALGARRALRAGAAEPVDGLHGGILSEH